MKSLLVFALWGVACCMAVSICPRGELRKCFYAPYDPSQTAEEMLDNECKEMKCKLEIVERCGDDYFEGLGPIPKKGYNKYLNTFCVKNHPLRRKYLENSKCFTEALWENQRDLLTDCGITLKPRDEFCRTISAGIQCLVDSITKKCGKDAREVIPVGAAAYVDIYDCLQQ